MIRRKMSGAHLLCLLLLCLQLSWAEDSSTEGRKTDNETVWSQSKTRRLFARQKISTSPNHFSQKYKSNATAPARRCSRLMESCTLHMPCCDPCASCHCRLFNTICHCWRVNPRCIKRA